MKHRNIKTCEKLRTDYQQLLEELYGTSASTTDVDEPEATVPRHIEMGAFRESYAKVFKKKMETLFGKGGSKLPNMTFDVSTLKLLFFSIRF